MIGPAAQRGQERYLKPHSQEVPGLGLCALPSHLDLSTQGDSLCRPESPLPPVRWFPGVLSPKGRLTQSPERPGLPRN